MKFKYYNSQTGETIEFADGIEFTPASRPANHASIIYLPFLIITPAPTIQSSPIEIHCFITAPLPINILLPTETSPFIIAPVAIWQ